MGNKTVFEPLKTSFLKGANQRQNSVLHFILDPTLHLNISVHYIYFSSNTFLKCHIASLTVFSFVQNHGRRFKYCGIVPSFILYPSSNKVIISIEIESCQVTFDSIITHSVIDCNKIINYQMKSRRLLVPVSVTRFLVSELYLLRYELEVERYETLVIPYSTRQYYSIQVYDGPGTLYHKLEPFVFKGEMALVNTTTFQCIIFVFATHRTCSDTTFMTHQDMNKIFLNKHKEMYVKTNQSVMITSQKLRDTEMHIQKMKTKPWLFFNITIHQIKHTGRNHSSCGYAGITFYDIHKNGTFQKISTLCHSNNNQEYNYRNIYTQYSAMSFVLYSYKKYSNISLNLTVSISHCEAIPINICEQEYDPLNLESNRIFSIKRQSCIVLQLNYAQENVSLFKNKSSNQFKSYTEISDGAYLKRGK